MDEWKLIKFMYHLKMAVGNAVMLGLLLVFIGIPLLFLIISIKLFFQ